MPTRGRHRSPDATDGGPVLAAAALVGPPRHRRARPDTADDGPGPGGLPARSLARVEAARAAASRPGVARRDPSAVSAAVSAVPTAPSRPAEPTAPVVVTGTPTDEPAEEAVTDLVARPGRNALPDGPGTGAAPALVGLVVSVVALVAALVTAVAAARGASHVTLLIELGLAVLGTGTAALGLGRQRRRRRLAATGVVVGVAAIAAGVIPLLTL
ncbi:hypothetical protein [Actinomycetospora termitidis]|uniref:Uncharacterized protein n=1 Tax=Actinomycetospora termitidis TaxID=3053470 RepID=A0ABT7M2R0_9PSEU|nr:hypothetical protein [Actinomycetospora sp. Odt1-22]MDL5154945.1 hypothetical protein [Actinomycetospora sp. Odt1-22]